MGEGGGRGRPRAVRGRNGRDRRPTRPASHRTKRGWRRRLVSPWAGGAPLLLSAPHDRHPVSSFFGSHVHVPTSTHAYRGTRDAHDISVASFRRADRGARHFAGTLPVERLERSPPSRAYP